MESTQRAIKFQFNYSKVSVSKFWVVILFVDIFAFYMNKYTSISMGIMQNGIEIGTHQGNSMLSIFGLNILAIIVYLIVYNYELYYKNFPIALSFNMVRKDFFKSMFINNVIVAFIFAVIQSIFMKMDPILVKIIGKVPVYDFKAFNIQTDSIIFIIIYLFIAFLSFMTMWNLIAILNYKFGAILWIVIGVLSVIGSSIFKMDLFDLIFPGNLLNMRMDILQFTIILAITILIYIAIYFISLNTNVKNKG